MVQSDEEIEFIKTYNIKEFDVPLTTGDVVIFTVIDEVLNSLLIRRDDHPERGKWAIPGGFLDIQQDIDLEGAALRKLKQETGVESPYLEQVGTFGDRSRDARGWSVTVVYFALINSKGVNLRHGEGATDACWFPVVGEGVDEALAFDHEQLLTAAILRLRNKAEYTTLPVHLLPEAFTLTDLQRMFEVVLQRPIEKSAFRRRIREANIVEAIPGEKRLGSNRPAQLYRYCKENPPHFFIRNLMGQRG